MTPPAILSIRDVRFAYADGPLILGGISLDVQEGTVTCLMGVNGCGKSTLIDCALGYQTPRSGSIVLGGQEISKLKPREMAFLSAYVPQVHERSFPYTVTQIVMMGRTARRGGLSRPETEDTEAVSRALHDTGMERFSERPYTSLSGGEMQMVLLARALVQDTPLILMDEPTAHLDFKNELLFLETVERLVKERGVAVLMATHSPNQAFHLANSGVPTSVAVMDRGKVRAHGDPAQVLTSELLEEVFLIEGFVTRIEDPGGEPGSGSGPVDQLVLRRTLERKDTRGNR